MPFSRTTKPKIWDSRNPELSLVDVLTSEKFSLYSPELKYWSFIQDHQTGAPPRDALDRVYGERGAAKSTFNGPYDVEGIFDINPIVQELTRLGLQQIEEVEFFVNIAAIQNRLLGVLPKGGDVVRISYIVTETDRRFVFYRVSTVKPVDIYNFKYVNLHLHCEQTLLDDVPEQIRFYNVSA